MESMVSEHFWKRKQVFITGHTGFKGSWLALWLDLLGADVVGYSLPSPTVPSHFESAQIGKGITTIESDVKHFDQLKKAIQTHNPEIVFHLAAQSLVRPSYDDPIETYSTNVMGTVNLLEAIRKISSVKVIINVTSDKCYENKEWVWGYRENDPVGGYDPYSSSKGCAELVSSAYLQSFFNPAKYDNHGVGLATARAGNVIGGGDFAEDRLIPDIVKTLSKGEIVNIRYPKAVRPWQHVLEPLSGYLELARRLYENGAMFSGAWNFGPTENDVKDVGWVVNKFVEAWGEEASWRVDKNKHPHEAGLLKLDCSKAYTILGWSSRLNIEKALKWTVEWYKEFYRNPDSVRKVTLQQIEEYENIISTT